MAELLAPAGSLTGMKAVIAAGADAVYIGGSRFGARAYADNPREDDLLFGIDYAHLRGVKVYMTVNTLLKEEEMADLYDYVLPYYKRGVDAILVQDFGVLRFLHRAFPDMPLHASTQMTITGSRMPGLLKEMGVTRVVPAREMSVAELREIKSSGLEVETFIHGALCVCYSGQCLMSSMIGGRSGNRGRCAQPCRMLFLMDDRTGYNGKPVITERREARHFLSPRDLNGIDVLPELYKMGIDSFKIEGRMKRPEYAAGVVSIYRKYLDLLEEGKPYRVTEEDQKALYDLYNRSGFTDGYFHKHNGADMMAPVKHELTKEETDARHALYEVMHETYMDHEKTVPVSGYAYVAEGQPTYLTLSAEDATATVEGPSAEQAKKQPMTEEEIRASLMKMGGTDFTATDMTVTTDGNAFLPKSALNDLRRRALESLRKEMLKMYLRDSEVKIKYEKYIQKDHTKENTQKSTLSALVSTTEQLDAALNFSETPLTIYVESYLLREISEAVRQEAEEKNCTEKENRNCNENGIHTGSTLTKSPYKRPATQVTPGAEPPIVRAAASLITRARAAGHRLVIALPYITRHGSEERDLCDYARDLIAHGLDGFLIRSTEAFAWANEEGLQDIVRLDAGVYIFNSEARRWAEDLGFRKDTVPVELNKKEIFTRDNQGSEIIVYGRLPLMVSAQCLNMTTGRCLRRQKSKESAESRSRMGSTGSAPLPSHTSESACCTPVDLHVLTDRMGMKFPVKSICDFCYTIVYNSVPLSLLPEMGTLARVCHTSSFRACFVFESAKETAAVLHLMTKNLVGGGTDDTEVPHTKGHYLRGVE